MAVFGVVNNSTGDINRSISSLEDHFQLVIHSLTTIAGSLLFLYPTYHHLKVIFFSLRMPTSISIYIDGVQNVKTKGKTQL